jgi:hypothetical protein
MRRFQTDEKMYVIGGTTDLEANPVQSANDASEVCMNAFAYLRVDGRNPIFRAEHEMVVKAHMR